MRVAYVNVRAYTVAPDQEWASAFIVTDGVITHIGTDDEVRGQIDQDDQVVDLQGRMAMPGIHDAHTHLVSGLNNWEVSFPAAADENGILVALQAWQGPRPTDVHGNQWLVGGRYWPTALGPRGPHRDFLDEAYPHHPVMLHDRSGHNVLTNSRGLELAGIDASTPDTKNGQVIRDRDGRPTGELYEHARWPLFRVMGRHDDDVVEQAIRYAVALNHHYGVTSVQDASSTAQLLRVLGVLDASNSLKLQVAGHLVWREESFGMADLGELDRMIEHHSDYASEHVDTRFVKFWLDGSPIPPYWTHSCIHEDGTVDEDHLLIPQEEMKAAVARFDALELSVKIHCGGEGAIRRALDAIQHARSVNGPDGPRHELAHCCLVADQDFPRFAQLNVGAEMSPAVWHLPEHNVSDMYFFDVVVASGAEMTLGTDWSVSASPNLFPALQGTVEHGAHSIDLKTGLAALTINGAKAVGKHATRGSLEVGKSADFIVLDRNLLEVPVSEVGDTKVLRTYFEGELVYDAADPARLEPGRSERRAR